MLEVVFDKSSCWQPPASAVPLWPGQPPGARADFHQPPPTLTAYLASAPGPQGAVIILPGGGYARKAAHEAGPVAEWLNSLGISAFVVDYRVTPYRHPIPLLDARRAIQQVRCKARAWSVDPQKIAVLGFSAGGHLAATAGTHFEDLCEPDLPVDEVAACDFCPNALILCYPVISFGPFGHPGSQENLIGSHPPNSLQQSLSAETQISSRTPPTFLWHTANDEAVPVENSLLFARGLSAQHIPFELHIFGEGQHGAGLASGHVSAAPWTDLCGQWLTRLGYASQK
jgi:acetyl esterase/lipase